MKKSAQKEKISRISEKKTIQTKKRGTVSKLTKDTPRLAADL